MHRKVIFPLLRIIQKMIFKQLRYLVIQIFARLQQVNRGRVIAILLLLPAIFFLIPTNTFLVTLLQSFAFQAMITYGILSTFWMVKGHRWPGMVSFALYLSLLVKVNTPFSITSNHTKGDYNISVMQFNVLQSNSAFDKTIAQVKKIAPDFVSFQEVSQPWAEKLEQRLKQDYPFYHIVNHQDPTQGIAVFSKYPLSKIQVFDWVGTANIAGAINLEKTSVNFITAHTKSPVSYKRWKDRNKHLQDMATYIRQTEGGFLALGDYNTVPWDQALKSFRRQTALQDSRKRLIPTYPMWSPFLGQIPIDYIFHSNGITCKSLDSISITSDHKAMVGRFIL